MPMTEMPEFAEMTESAEKLLTVVCYERDLDALLARLMSLDGIKLLATEETSLPNEVSRPTPDKTALDDYTELLSLADKAIEYLLPYKAEYRPTAGTGSFGGTSKLNSEQIRRAEKIIQSILEIKRLLDGTESEEKKADRIIGILSPWASYTENVRITETASTRIFYGTIPTACDIGTLSLGNDLTDILVINDDGHQKYIRAVCHISCADSVRSSLDSQGFVPESFSNVNTSLKSTLINARKKLMQLEADRIRSDMMLADYSEHMSELEEYRAFIAERIAVELAKSEFVYFDKYVCFKCRLPEDSALSAQTYLRHKLCAFELADIPDAVTAPSRRRAKRQKG